jgi:uncharacterized glyoxalase superfamily protein PhnB
MKAKPKAKAKSKAKSKAMRAKSKAKSSVRQATLMPHLVCAGAAKAIDFYKKAFGASELMRLPGKDGKLVHGAVEINGACVMLVDEMPEWGALSPKALKGTPVTVHLVVDDVDAVFKRAVKAGATAIMPVADMFWGDRYGVLEDPFGHRWSVATHVRDMTPKEIQKAMPKEMMCP